MLLHRISGENMQRSLIAGNVRSDIINRNIGVSRLLHSEGLFWVTCGTCLCRNKLLLLGRKIDVNFSLLSCRNLRTTQTAVTVTVKNCLFLWSLSNA